MENSKECKFDTAFDRYLTDEIHEQVEEAIFQIVKHAFSGGWNAANQTNQNK